MAGGETSGVGERIAWAAESEEGRFAFAAGHATHSRRCDHTSDMSTSAREIATDDGEHSVDAERLREITMRLDELNVVLHLMRRCHDDDLCMRAGQLSVPSHKLHTIHHWHPHVQQDEVWPVGRDLIECRLSVLSFQHVVSGVAQGPVDGRPNPVVVVHNEDRAASGYHQGPTDSRGSVTTNRVPPPSAGSASIWPPWRSTICRLIKSPSPMPEVG